MRKEGLGGKEIEKACVDPLPLYGSLDEQALMGSECQLRKAFSGLKGMEKRHDVGEEAGGTNQGKHWWNTWVCELLLYREKQILQNKFHRLIEKKITVP